MTAAANTKPATKKAATKKPTAGAFDGLADMLNAGDLGALTSDNGQDFSLITIAEIAVKEQVREIFEDDENRLEDLAESIRLHGVFQPIIIRPIAGPLPFELVAGERRLRASILAQLEQIPAMVRELSDEQAEAIQVAENIQRKNLTQIETARRLQRDLDELGGDIEALMAKRQKSRAWISKWLSILDLPEQAQRVITESVSADPEVILAVKQVEKVSPAAAKELVDDLKQGRGKKGENARDKAQAAKDAVKPPKKPRKEKTPPTNPDNVATPKDRSHEEAGPVTTVTLGDVSPSTFQALNQAIKDENAGQSQDDNDQEEQPGSPSMLDDIFADAKKTEGTDEQAEEGTQEAAGGANSGDEGPSNVPALPPVEALDKAFSLVFESGSSAKMVLDCMEKDERENCKNWLNSFYEVGTSSKDVSRAVIMGFRSGNFATEGHGALALAAFLYGADSNAKFSMLDIIGSVKA
jgi:ParB family chromosome partitioning protein